MRAVALAWGVLGLAGIALSVIAIARLPLADIGDTFKTVLVLTMCAGALFGFWAAVRDRWPDIRVWQMPGSRIELGWYLLVFCSVLGFAGITVAISEAVRDPTVGPFQLGALFTMSVIMLIAAWALERSLLRLIAIIAIMCCLALFTFFPAKVQAIWHGGALALLALSITTLWLSRRRVAT
jgi:hypothetical protein